MFTRVLLYVCVCIAVLACQREGQDAASLHNIDQVAETASEFFDFDQHYTGAGKQLALILSTRDSIPRQWLLRVVDGQGLPVESAYLEVRVTSPVSATPQTYYITPEVHEGDGFYPFHALQINQPGRWHLDFKVSWKSAEQFSQEDHLQITVQAGDRMK